MPEMHALSALAVPSASAADDALTRAVFESDADLLHAVYLATPGYFDMIAIPVPTAAEVRVELAAAAQDPRRHIELVLAPASWAHPEVPTDPHTQRPVAGVLDVKTEYPEAGDATVNLLLIHQAYQRKGIGAEVVRGLEQRLHGRARRVLAAVYGRNPSACGFWERQGYRFAIDAKPVLEWYAKELPEHDH
jgi:GNAT superfamily N-acetyltransferase